jgi:hypothetical protein
LGGAKKENNWSKGLHPTLAGRKNGILKGIGVPPTLNVSYRFRFANLWQKLWGAKMPYWAKAPGLQKQTKNAFIFHVCKTARLQK